MSRFLALAQSVAYAPSISKKDKLCAKCKSRPPEKWFIRPSKSDAEPLVLVSWTGFPLYYTPEPCPVCRFARDIALGRHFRDSALSELWSFSAPFPRLCKVLESAERVLTDLKKQLGEIVNHVCDGLVYMCGDCGLSLGHDLSSVIGDPTEFSRLQTWDIVNRLETLCSPLITEGRRLDQLRPISPTIRKRVAAALEALVAAGIQSRRRINRVFMSHDGSERCWICKRHRDRFWQAGGEDEFELLFDPDMEKFLNQHLQGDDEVQSKAVRLRDYGSKMELVRVVTLPTYSIHLDFFHYEEYPWGDSKDEHGNELQKAFRKYMDKPQNHSIFVPLVRPPKYGGGYRIRPRFDINLAKSWLRTCEASHIPTCTGLQGVGTANTPAPTGLFLIDTHDWCLFKVPDESSAGIRYVALSYVWGKVQQPQLSASTVATWQEPGRLRSQPLPATVKDAITLANSLGFRYLWVDALCIVQDEPGLRHEQIAQMFRIYNSACLTIVAADSDRCDTGISGVSVFSTRSVGRGQWNIMGTEIMMVPESPHLLLNVSTWRKRGWTFQEELCSRRALIFLPNLVIFSCQTATWREDVCLENSFVTPLPRGKGILTIRDGAGGAYKAAVPLFRDLTNQYLSRMLTRKGDIENAFEGVAELMNGLVGPLYHGIPERHFDEVIQGCWYWDYDLVRRPPFPSWSWTGWHYNPAHVEMGIEPLNSWGNRPVLRFFAISDPPRELFADTLDPPSHPHFEPDLEAMTEALANLEPAQPRHGLVAFFTSCAVLKVIPSRKLVFENPEEDGVIEYLVVDPQGRTVNPLARDRRSISAIKLRQSFVSRAGNLLPFIVSGWSGDVGYRLMVIEDVAGLSYKVQVTVPGRPVRADVWWELQPEKRLVIMA
ncbi:heterokaryon incompatibility protein-domain-containing protein [Echria macrotheca]|uniref:Heterokaryon incompatibility protein-domain-containing protein n=1 Tax=Echria macrotheca TaxID=438768 RepID=A0AAJ0F914_9PEZI|nr:heterokaryon incompatibility protein-domain-containing protein [Echria macrotheca]